MKFRLRSFLSLPVLLVALSVFSQPPPRALRGPFHFRDGDRVALVGDSLIEREQFDGYIEERITVQFPDTNLIFRNLGWSADKPDGISRASFDFNKPGKSFEKLKEQIAAVQPTVVIVGYGMASSFDGEAGLPKFKTDMDALLDAIQKQSTNKAPVRFIFLSPVYHEKLPGFLADTRRHNEDLLRYLRAVDEVGIQRQSHFVNLFDLLGDGLKSIPPRPFTENGIHLGDYGYLRAAEALEKHLHWEQNFWRIGITADGKIADGSYGTKVSNLTRTSDDVHFSALDDRLVLPKLYENGKRIRTHTADCLIQIAGLKRGDYELKIDGNAIASGSEKDWARGVVIERGPQFEQAEELRQAILKKNELHFHQWRPANETYLFGFRKHEQGKNAAEMPMFDPLIAGQEKKIATLRKPVAHSFELVRKMSGSKVGRGVPTTPRTSKALPDSDGARGVTRPASPQQLPDLEVAPGFQVNLWAETPLLNKPIQINFDPRGRLWVASSEVYPQIEPGKTADDKILILEDVNHDGRADISTVFAGGLLIPTGVAPGDGGAYVGQSTDLLFLKDTDGDGKADVKRRVLSGFGTEDTHHIIHTLQWGFDGRLYFNQSIYIHSHAETPNGVVRLNSGGVWRLRPGPLDMEVFLRGFCNPWGHAFDAFGESFVTDGAGGQGINFGVPGATYFTYAEMRRELKSISPGSYPKFCGLEIIRSEHFPKDWQGNAITCDFRAHRVVRFGIQEKDSAFAAKELSDLLRTTNVTFRPIDVKLGPDGALYIADWSNPIIQHGEVDFRDPRRDHVTGRIWRVTAKDRPLVPQPKLANTSNHKLLDELLSPNSFNENQARRVLTERGEKILPDLKRWTKTQKDERALLEALWMYQSLSVIEPALLQRLLEARDGRIRAAATRVVGDWSDKIENPITLLAKLIADSHPRVRLEAARALAKIPGARSAELVLSALDKPMDSFLDYGIWLSINDLAKPWLEAVKSGGWKPEGRETQLEFALKAIEPSLAGEVLEGVLQTRTIPRDGSGPWIDLIGTSGTEKELRRLFDQVLQNGFDDAAAVHALKSLGEAARLRQLKPVGDLSSLSSLFTKPDDRIRAEAFKLVGRWKLEKLIEQSFAAARDKNSSVELRRATIEAMRELGGEKVIAELEWLSGKESEPQLRRQALLALAALDFNRAKEPLLNVLTNFDDEAIARGFWRSLLTIKDAASKVALILPRSDLPAATAKAGLRAAREGGRSEPELVFALSRGAGLDTAGETLTTAELQELARQAQRDGDAARGEKIYQRPELACVTCHAIGGVGGKVGPDMASIGASAPLDYIIESMLYPNRKVKEGFHSVLVETKNGEEYSGVLVSEAGGQLVLRDATGREISIANVNIKERRTGGSLMPSGLGDGLTPGERLDLFRYLSELGKPGPYDAPKAK